MLKSLLHKRVPRLAALLTLTLSALLPSQLSARSFTSEGFSYKILDENNRTVEISGLADSGYGSGSLILPESVTDNSTGVTYTLVRIGDDAFRYCSGFTGSLTIPNSVTSIGNGAFAGCSGFSGTLTIPNSVTEIGGSAFFVCSGFTGKLTIPNSVTTIKKSAFQGCSGFTGTLNIPNSVTEIGYYAFDGCRGFSGMLTIPNSVTEIGDGAFYNCSGFTSITIPNSVTTIGVCAFNGCSSLTSINVNAANQAYSSKDGVLYNKDQTSLIRYPGGKLGEVIIPNSVTTIGESAFEECSNLTSITIPNSVTTIGDRAFFYCSSLTSITIPNSVTTIGYYAFFDCSSLTSVTSLAVTPPECGVGTFSGVDTYNCTLYVPAKSIQAYKQASEWKKFVKIETVEDAGIEDIPVDGDGMQSGKPDDIYNLQGICIKRNATQEDIDALAPGLYIIGGKKVRVK